jgi:hypothetical protein
MDMEVRKKDLPHPKVKQDTNALFTTGVILEISVAIIISSESDVKSILLNKVLIVTGCTRSIIKQNKLHSLNPGISSIQSLGLQMEIKS